MMSPTLSSPNVANRIHFRSIFERLKQRCSKFSQKTAKRFKEASQAYQQFLENEAIVKQRILALSQQAPPVARSVELSGYLMDPTHAIPLFSGTNFFAIETSGELKRLGCDGNAQTGNEYDFLITISEQGLTIQFSGSEKPKAYDGNETVELGKCRYILKLLPMDYRIKTQVLIHSEGKENQ